VTPLDTIPDSIKKQPKKIDVNLSTQTLSYYYGDYLVGTIKISSGIAQLPTPTGTFHVLAKIPVKNYAGRNPNGTHYYLPNTKWNLRFSVRGYYIHGAYWHNNFGHPMSHGCINVSYQDMPQLYEFASAGTLITIHK
jgi:lipoprotein-anchoring transpeptidase ErfK/SrfK